MLFQAAPPPEAVALKYFVVPPKLIVGSVTLNVVPVPKTVSVCPDSDPCVTDPLVRANVVDSPRTTSVCLLNDTSVTTSVKSTWVSPIFSQVLLPVGPIGTYSS